MLSSAEHHAGHHLPGAGLEVRQLGEHEQEREQPEAAEPRQREPLELLALEPVDGAEARDHGGHRDQHRRHHDDAAEIRERVQQPRRRLEAERVDDGRRVGQRARLEQEHERQRRVGAISASAARRQPALR